MDSIIDKLLSEVLEKVSKNIPDANQERLRNTLIEVDAAIHTLRIMAEHADHKLRRNITTSHLSVEDNETLKTGEKRNVQFQIEPGQRCSIQVYSGEPSAAAIASSINQTMGQGQDKIEIRTGQQIEQTTRTQRSFGVQNAPLVSQRPTQQSQIDEGDQIQSSLGMSINERALEDIMQVIIRNADMMSNIGPSYGMAVPNLFNENHAGIIGLEMVNEFLAAYDDPRGYYKQQTPPGPPRTCFTCRNFMTPMWHPFQSSYICNSCYNLLAYAAVEKTIQTLTNRFLSDDNNSNLPTLVTPVGDQVVMMPTNSATNSTTPAMRGNQHKIINRRQRRAQKKPNRPANQSAPQSTNSQNIQNIGTAANVTIQQINTDSNLMAQNASGGPLDTSTATADKLSLPHLQNLISEMINERLIQIAGQSRNAAIQHETRYHNNAPMAAAQQQSYDASRAIQNSQAFSMTRDIVPPSMVGSEYPNTLTNNLETPQSPQITQEIPQDQLTIPLLESLISNILNQHMGNSEGSIGEQRTQR
ncbi:hypothetical protein ACOME3_000082 [Neoechinorhynchus agilis]